MCMVPFHNEFPRPGARERMMVCMVPFDNEFPRPRPLEEMMVCMVPFDNLSSRFQGFMFARHSGNLDTLNLETFKFQPGRNLGFKVQGFKVLHTLNLATLNLENSAATLRGNDGVHGTI